MSSNTAHGVATQAGPLVSPQATVDSAGGAVTQGSERSDARKDAKNKKRAEQQAFEDAVAEQEQEEHDAQAAGGIGGEESLTAATANDAAATGNAEGEPTADGKQEEEADLSEYDSEEYELHRAAAERLQKKKEALTRHQEKSGGTSGTMSHRVRPPTSPSVKRTSPRAGSRSRTPPGFEKKLEQMFQLHRDNSSQMEKLIGFTVTNAEGVKTNGRAITALEARLDAVTTNLEALVMKQVTNAITVAPVKSGTALAAQDLTLANHGDLLAAPAVTVSSLTRESQVSGASGVTAKMEDSTGRAHNAQQSSETMKRNKLLMDHQLSYPHLAAAAAFHGTEGQKLILAYSAEFLRMAEKMRTQQVVQLYNTIMADTKCPLAEGPLRGAVDAYGALRRQPDLASAVAACLKTICSCIQGFDSPSTVKKNVEAIMTQLCVMVRPDDLPLTTSDLMELEKEYAEMADAWKNGKILTVLLGFDPARHGKTAATDVSMDAYKKGKLEAAAKATAAAEAKHTKSDVEHQAQLSDLRQQVASLQKLLDAAQTEKAPKGSKTKAAYTAPPRVEAVDE